MPRKATRVHPERKRALKSRVSRLGHRSLQRGGKRCCKPVPWACAGWAPGASMGGVEGCCRTSQASAGGRWRRQKGEGTCTSGRQRLRRSDPPAPQQQLTRRSSSVGRGRSRAWRSPSECLTAYAAGPRDTCRLQLEARPPLLALLSGTATKLPPRHTALLSGSEGELAYHSGNVRGVLQRPKIERSLQQVPRWIQAPGTLAAAAWLQHWMRRRHGDANAQLHARHIY